MRWFGDCRYVLKNGQLKWLESYQAIVEEEDFQKANLEALKEHLEAHGKLEETQAKELAKASSLTEDLVRRWFTNKAPLLLLAAKEGEKEGGTAAAPEKEGGATEKEGGTTATEVKAEAVAVEKESKVEGTPAVAVEKESKVEGTPAAAEQDQGIGSEEKTEQSSSDSAVSTSESAETATAEAKSTDPNQGLS